MNEGGQAFHIFQWSPLVGWLSDLLARITGSDAPVTPAEELKKAKVLVFYHPMYGRIETMAQSVAQGAR